MELTNRQHILWPPGVPPPDDVVDLIVSRVQPDGHLLRQETIEQQVSEAKRVEEAREAAEAAKAEAIQVEVKA